MTVRYPEMSSITRVVAITGCDSGLGWAIAARSAREGLVTIAGMFQGTDTKAAAALRKLCAHPYSVDVTNPESGFVSSSNIIAQQIAHGKAMLENLTEEQKVIYEKKITALTNYLGSSVPADEARYDSLRDVNIIEAFMKALTEDDPVEIYKVESWRYKLYYNLLKLPFPETAQNWLVKMFLNFPEVE
ncbi:Short-chain dehydrogenase/reductase [Operophtera brumata]|uniref:Short-chain dehydrogenase/reductase n=1 Tax=Operophtera brumata TaxID=104452 RepID=A0A0L7LC39_OPEBR|nr:Short-chain dehydrogenase/reductase [Operophtera brumata]